jgi:hypothetical protein
MSSVILRAPVVRHRWTVPALFRFRHRRRRAEGVFVAIMAIVDLPPT